MRSSPQILESSLSWPIGQHHAIWPQVDLKTKGHINAGWLLNWKGRGSRKRGDTIRNLKKERGISEGIREGWRRFLLHVLVNSHLLLIRSDWVLLINSDEWHSSHVTLASFVMTTSIRFRQQHLFSPQCFIGFFAIPPPWHIHMHSQSIYAPYWLGSTIYLQDVVMVTLSPAFLSPQQFHVTFGKLIPAFITINHISLWQQWKEGANYLLCFFCQQRWAYRRSGQFSPFPLGPYGFCCPGNQLPWRPMGLL